MCIAVRRSVREPTDVVNCSFTWTMGLCPRDRRLAARGICGTLRAVVPVDAFWLRRPSPPTDRSPVAVAIAPAANPAMAVGSRAPLLPEAE